MSAMGKYPKRGSKRMRYKTDACVYALINIETDDIFYVGSTINLNVRLNGHCSYIKKGLDYPIYNYILNNNVVFSVEVLEEKRIWKMDEIREIESKWIGELKLKHTLYNVFIPNGKCLIEPRVKHFNRLIGIEKK
jgi:hypothetical protein